MAVAPSFTYIFDVPWFATKNDFRYSEADNMETADADKTVTPPLAGEVIVLAPVTARTLLILVCAHLWFANLPLLPV